MVEVTDLEGSSKVCLGVFGDPGCGKTTLIGSGGRVFKTLIIRPPIDHVDSILGSGCKQIITRDWDDMSAALEYVRHEGDQWDWIWIDSLSLYQDVGMDDIWEAVVARAPHRYDNSLDRGEYRVNMHRIETHIRQFVSAGKFNLGITFHPFWEERPKVFIAEENEPDNSNGLVLMPWVQGKAMPQKICGYMNVVAYMEVRQRGTGANAKEYRVLHTDKSPRYYAKNQFRGAFGEDGRIVNPTMPKIMESINSVRRPAAGVGRPVRNRTRPRR